MNHLSEYFLEWAKLDVLEEVKSRNAGTPQDRQLKKLETSIVKAFNDYDIAFTLKPELRPSL